MTTTTIEKTESQVTPAEATWDGLLFRPNVDILENEEELTVLADMPGTCSEDIDIQLENGTLTLYAKVRGRQSASQRYALNEYGIGDFQRTFRISQTIDTKKISAEYRNGVLTLHLPKTEQAKPRKIGVKAVK